jgi:hypothetical protein
VNAVLRSLCAAIALSVLAVSVPVGEVASAVATCGSYRWRVQTLSDPARRHVASRPTTTSIAQLRSLAAPAGLDDTSPRQPPTETSLWSVHARILEARVSPNGDVRAVIAPRDDVRETMMVVFHARHCIGSAYRRTKQANARSAVLDACGRIGSTWTELGGLVTVTGVGFWNSPASVGAAPNGIQLNPVVRFRGSCWHTRGVFTALLVGDSVPHQLATALADTTGWRVLDATNGGCPVTGEEPVDATGASWTGDDDCRHVVPPLQRDAMADHPDLVLWWDRPSISHFLTPRGHFIRAGSARFWRWRREALDRTVHRLSADGATVALIATEPAGFMIDWTHGWHHFMVRRYDDLTARWNRMMAHYASTHPVIGASVSITDLICHVEASPCDDTFNGLPARPKGQHYEGPGIPMAIDALLQRLAPVTDRLRP